MRKHRIAAVPGDGIGPEVIAAGLEVLDVVAGLDGGFALETQNFDWGSDRYRRSGRMMPEDGVATLRGFDAIYFGAVGDPKIPRSEERCVGKESVSTCRPRWSPYH